MDDLFSVKDSSGVLSARGDAVAFAEEHGCLFCMNMQLPLRARPTALLPRALRYPIVQPFRGERALHIVKVSSVRLDQT